MTASTATQPVKQRKLSMRQRESIDFYISIAPWLIGFFLFTGGPILFSMIMSLTDWSGLTTRNFIGIQNYVTMLSQDKLFWIALKNTFYYAFASVALGTLGALLAAMLLNQKVPGTSIFRTLFYLPSVTSGVAVAIMWIWMFNPQVGIINYLLSLIGIKGPGLAEQPDLGHAGAHLHEPVGHRRQYDHHPGRPSGHPGSPLRSRED